MSTTTDSEDSSSGFAWQHLVSRQLVEERLTSIAQLLTELLAEVKRGNSVAREGAVSSVEVKFLAKGEPAPVVKVYAGSVPDVDAALEAYGRAVMMMQQATLNGWQETLAMLGGAGD